MSVSRSEILQLLGQQAMGEGLIGGRRRRVGRPRKYHVRGRGENDEMFAMEEIGDGMYGDGLIGGYRRRRRRRRVGAGLIGGTIHKPMSAATKSYLAHYHKTHPRRRRVRGRGDYDDMIADWSLQKGEDYAQAKAGVDAWLIAHEKLIKSGIYKPRKKKHGIIEAIKIAANRVGIKPMTTEQLNKYNVAALTGMLKKFKDAYISYPPGRDDIAYGELDHYDF